jgi:hypothetical protein
VESGQLVLGDFGSWSHHDRVLEKEQKKPFHLLLKETMKLLTE